MASAFGIGSTAFTVWMLASLRMVTSSRSDSFADTRKAAQVRREGPWSCCRDLLTVNVESISQALE